MPNDLHSPQAFQNLSHCLRYAADLRTLKLAFQGRKKISISPLLCTFEEHEFSFKKLEEVVFEGVTSTEREMGVFLVRQKALRRIRLGGEGLRNPHQPVNGGVHLREGWFGGLFGKVERQMKPERLEIMGDLVGLESGEIWILDTVEEVKNLKEYVLD
jgi:hypothetical protein